MPAARHVIGITGVPGSGKSTLVSVLTRKLRAGDNKVGIVAIDPSSPYSGGSILGDRVRMTDLINDPGVYVRSMATHGMVGGMARAALDAVDILDVAGFDVVILETVGVGQDEVDIARASHTTIVVSAPGLGDGIQAIKAGILEIADIHVVSKCDRSDANFTLRDLKSGVMPTGANAAPGAWIAPIIGTSAIEETRVRRADRCDRRAPRGGVRQRSRPRTATPYRRVSPAQNRRDDAARQLRRHGRTGERGAGGAARATRDRPLCGGAEDAGRLSQAGSEAMSRDRTRIETERQKLRQWEENEVARFVRRQPERRDRFRTHGGLPVNRIYTEADIGDHEAGELGLPGQYPFTRGPYPTMYRGRYWTMRQIAGFGTGEDTNQRFKYLIAKGQTGLSTDFDMPTLMGYDSDHPMSEGEVGREGVAVDTIADMEALFEGIDLENISVSMTINPTAWILLAMYVVVAERRGHDLNKLSGTIQADILKEYMAQKEYIYPDCAVGAASCATASPIAPSNMKRYNPINISGYHISEAGASPLHEAAFTLANAVVYVEEVCKTGLDVDAFAPRLAFYFVSQADFFEEIAKFRAVRRCYAKIMKERFAAKHPESMRAALPLPDRGGDADQAAIRDQYGSHDAASAGGGGSAAVSRCTPTATTRRSRFPPRRR